MQSLFMDEVIFDRIVEGYKHDLKPLVSDAPNVTIVKCVKGEVGEPGQQHGFDINCVPFGIIQQTINTTENDLHCDTKVKK